MQKFLDGLTCSESTKLKYVAIISHMYNVARRHWKSRCTTLLIRSLSPVRERRASDGLGGDELNRLLKALDSSLRRNRELSYLARLAIATACRESELLKLEWRGVDLDDGDPSITVRDTKNSSTRTVPLSLRGGQGAPRNQRQNTKDWQGLPLKPVCCSSGVATSSRACQGRV